MRKTIVFGSLLAVFLMLMIPIGPALEYKSNRDIIDSVEKSMEYVNEMETSTPCQICMLEEKIQSVYPEFYNFFLEKKDKFEKFIQTIEFNQPPGEILCVFCILFVYMFGFFILYWLIWPSLVIEAIANGEPIPPLFLCVNICSEVLPP